MYEGAAEELPLASLSLTHVHYVCCPSPSSFVTHLSNANLAFINQNPEDPVSLLCAYLSLLPQAIIIVYVTLLWAHRELEVGLAFAGQLGCEAVNWVLKRVIRETRPSRMYPPSLQSFPKTQSHCFYHFKFQSLLTILALGI